MNYRKRTTSIDVESIRLNDLQKSKRNQVVRKLKDGIYQTENVDCPLCGKKPKTEIANKDRLNIPFQVKICHGCGFVFTSPRMNQNSFNDFYNNEYRPLYTGNEHADESFYEEQINQGNRIISYINESIPDFHQKEKFILEIGCGAGGILTAFKNYGHQVLGLDIGEEYIEFGKKQGIELRNGTLESVDIEKQPDLIIYSHVMEHILDLDKEITALREKCHPNTIVYIEVPGLMNIHNAYLGDIMKYYQNAHTYHFTLESLQGIMSKNGFKLISGNQFVRSIFQVGQSEMMPEEKHYNDVIQYLTKHENRLPYYDLTRPGLRNKAIKIAKRVKSLFP